MDAATPKPRARRRDTDESRAERKRIQDRLAQRATRERTKNRIAYLEQRLSSLEAGDKQGEIASLTKIIDNLRNDNNKLKNALVKMRATIDQAILPMDDASETKSKQVPPAFDASSSNFEAPTPTYNGHRGRHDSTSTDTTDVTEVVNGHPVNLPQPNAMGNMAGLEDFFDLNPNSLLDMFEMGPSGFQQWHASSPSPFDYRFPPSPENITVIAADEEKWHVSNNAFINCIDSVKSKSASNITLDLHVPFKAAIWGWENVGPEANHPVWNALRQVDQRVFGTWTSKAQRIALMYVCQTLIQYRENPTKENLERVPVFLRPRPSQEKIQHPAVIDFLIWPGLRDRLVFEHKKYTASGAFSAAFVKNFNFHWPYSDRDIFAFNPANNRYEVSKIFLEYAYNFKNWTMKPGFFKEFPEMQHDIAATADDGIEYPRASWD